MTRDKLSVDFDQSILGLCLFENSSFLLGKSPSLRTFFCVTELLLKLLMGDRHGESCRGDEKKVSYEDIVRRTRY